MGSSLGFKPRRLLTALAFVFVFSTGIKGCGDKRPDISQDLIDTFSNGCTSTGFWTESALTHTNGLLNSLKKIKADGPCAALHSTLSQIQVLNGQLANELANPNYLAYRYNEENINELTLALKQPGLDPAIQTSLTTALSEAQAQVYGLRSKYFVDQNALALTGMGTVVQTLVQQAKDMPYCFEESPASALKLATNSLAVAGSFISPIIGAGVGVLGSLMNGVVEYARSHGSSKAIWKLYSAKMPTALSCGLESMSNLYCQASDAFQLLSFQKNSYPENGQPPNAIWMGMDLLSRRLPVLSRWLLQVSTGVSPSNGSEAEKQNSIWNKDLNLNNLNRSVVGGLAGALQLYRGAATDGDKQSITANTVLSFARNLVPMCEGCTTPLSSLSTNSAYFACWIVDGYRDVSKGTDPLCPPHNAQNETLEVYVKRVLLPHANIFKFEENWRPIFFAAKRLVDLEFSQTITLNPGDLLRRAYSHDGDNISPHEVLIMLRDYLILMLTEIDGKNPNDRPVMEQTLKTVNESLALIENTDPDEKTASGRVRSLIEKLDLKQSARAFFQVINSIVSTDVQNRIDRGEFPTEIEDILRAAGLDIHMRLASAGIEHIGPLISDINNSRSLTQSNITIFRDHFKSLIAKSVEKLYDEAHPRTGPGERAAGVDRPKGQTLAKLCMLVISTGHGWPDEKTGQICSKQTLYSIYGNPAKKNDPLTVRIAELEYLLRNKSLQDKFCTYYKYTRAERLAEVLKRLKKNPRPKKQQIQELIGL